MQVSSLGTFLVRSPLCFQAPREVAPGKRFQVLIEFTNPLPISLTSVVVYVEGPGIVKQAKYNLA